MSKILIVIDMLNDFVHKDGTLFFPTGAEIIPAVKARIDAYGKAGHLIIFVNDSHDKDDKEFDRFDPHAITNTWGSEVVAELATTDKDIYIDKKRYSGFYGTDLGEYLRTWGADEVEVVGVCTSICVMDTVGGLANRDYKITVPLNAVADFDEAAHHSALGRMSTLYGAEIIQP